MKFSNLKVGILIICFLFASNAWAQTQKITGKVTSEDGTPLIGVTISEKGKQPLTITDAKGTFEVNVPVGTELLFSSTGFDSVETKAGKSSTMEITMVTHVSRLDEVVIGYGTQKKSSLTGAVTSISIKQMEKQIGSTVASTLQGLAPGVEVIQPGGIAGADVKILIRGAATFGSTAPLYVIDGAFSNSSLNSLNPNDIQSIEILKDASAAAIYGSRAANGVVLITTKKGKKGPPIIEFNVVYAQQTPAKRLHYLNASQYRSFMNMVADNSGLAHAPQNDNPTNPNVNTDWQDAWLQPAPMYSTNLGISGGGENSTYHISFGYLDQKGMTVTSEFKRYDFRANSSFKKGRLSINESFSLSRQNTAPTAITSIGIPTVPIFDSKGNYTSGTTDFYLQAATVSNPLAARHFSPSNNYRTLLIGSLDIGYTILPGLEYKISAGGSYEGDNNLSHGIAYNTLFTTAGVGIAAYGRDVNSISEGRGDQFDYNIDNLLSYKRGFGKHNLNALLGTSWVQQYSRTNHIATISDLGATNITGTNGDLTGTINASEDQFALLSYFSRIIYDFENKYLFSASVRNDISSKFSRNFRSGWFPSVSAGWNINKENWFDSKTISQLKLRVSYGELGANFIDPYQFNNTLLGPIPSPFGLTSLSFVSAYAVHLFPLDLTWETSVSKNIGIDFGLLDNKITGTVEYFERTNKNLLASIAPPVSSGQGLTQPATNTSSVQLVNSASVQNRGVEITLGYNKTQGEFRWNLTGNLSTTKNKVLKLGDNVSPIVGPIMDQNIGDNITITEAGYPIGSFYGFEAVGLTDDGRINIKGFDADGHAVFKPIEKGLPSDKKIIGSPYPDFTYGVNFSGDYKNFDFTLFFQGVQGNDIFNWQKLRNYFAYTDAVNLNLVTDVLNSWTPTNTNTNIPKASIPMAAQSGRPSTWFIEDGSYLRLKNLQIGYNVETNKSLKGTIKTLRFYAGVQNLITITKYSGYDPEVASPSVVGRQTNGTSTTRNVDLANFPNSRTYTVGINLSF